MPVKFLNGISVTTSSNNTITASGAEQTMLETTSYNWMEGYVDTTNLATGDTVVIKSYAKIKSGGSYIKMGSRIITGAQDPALLYIREFPIPTWGFKITLQQSAGTNRTYDWYMKLG
jgi:hypothetical protein